MNIFFYATYSNQHEFLNTLRKKFKNDKIFTINDNIDLSKIDFLDSSGLGALVQTSKECKKLKLGFSVVGNSRVAQTIKLVRLADFLNLKANLQEAFLYLKN